MGWALPRTTTEKGYGSRHQRERKRWAERVKHGGVQCARCGLEILPWDDWHLDHDSDRTAYIGVSHAYCNTTEPARRRGRTAVVHWQNPEW